ncbi:MAG: dephospho-CoA kinase [Oscillospiraceae bacterium]|nr:dephospho-CoA kinase [Oscillospiraceae bacterium]
MKILGITGPTGAGKTTLLHYLQSQGAVVIDCDALYKELMSRPSPLRLAVEETFGAEFFPHGELDRGKLGKLVFENPQELETLNRLVFEHLTQDVKNTLARLEQEGVALVAIDAINLIQSGLASLCHSTVAVLADETSRLSRIMARDAMTQDDALRRIRAQEKDDFYHQHATLVLDNSGTQEEFLQKLPSALQTLI